MLASRARRGTKSGGFRAPYPIEVTAGSTEVYNCIVHWLSLSMAAGFVAELRVPLNPFLALNRTPYPKQYAQSLNKP